MIKRTLEISREPAHLAVRLDQLLIRRRDTDAEADGQTTPSIPCEDIGVVIVDHPSTTYSHAALVRLMDYGGVVVLCGRDHLPVGMLLPMVRHTEVVWRIQAQINVARPLRKQLWKQIVVAKVRAQAVNIPPGSSARSRLLALAREVRSGDPTNVEAQAARIYWSAWLGDLAAAADFRRDPDKPGINAFLNYGYAVLRAAVARAIVAAGLHPTLGIRHANRSDAFCLADDLVEPIRPLVDARVRHLWREGRETLDQSAKAALLALLTAPVRVGDQSGPLMVGLHRTVASLVRCYEGATRRLLLPVAIDSDEQPTPAREADAQLMPPADTAEP